MAGKKFEFLEHTADAKFRAYGSTLEEAFANAALAMFTIMADCSKVKPRVHKKVSAEGIDVKALLYSFLEELIFIMDTEEFLLGSVDKVTITKPGTADRSARYALKAAVSGDTVEGHDAHSLVKAVTYSDMEVVEKKGACVIQVVVDI